MPFDASNQTPTDLGMTVEEMEEIGERAKKIRAAHQRLRDAEQRLAFLKKHSEQRKKHWEIESSWEPALILAKQPYGRDITIKVKLPYAIVEQQLVDDVKRAKRELILLGGRP